MSLYHRYRPQIFADLVGQDYIRTVLQEALKADRLVHAYLFSGSRGTGKTTTARLLAKAINCLNLKDGEPCNNCALCKAITAGNCLDVIEIDAASNRGIDEIKSLQDQSRFKPQQGKKKVIIIDEVHMLTKEAFNALLKTLEEPPEHLVFILATTEAHKLPATVISRCQRFSFQTPDVEVLSRYLGELAKKESVKVEALALTRLAALAKGSYRDAATLFEQIVAGGSSLSEAEVVAKLGLPDDQLLEQYLVALDGGLDSVVRSQLSVDLNNYWRSGGQPTPFLDTAFLWLGTHIEVYRNPARILSKLVEVKRQLKYAPNPELPIILAISDSFNGKVSDKSELVSKPKAEPKVEQKAPKVEPLAVAVAEVAVVGETKEEKEEFVTVQVAEQVAPVVLPDTALTEHWQKVIEKLLADSQSSLVSILRTAKPLDWQPPALKISVQFKFHADQLSKQKNRDILESAFAAVLGSAVRLDPIVEPPVDLASEAEQLFS